MQEAAAHYRHAVATNRKSVLAPPIFAEATAMAPSRAKFARMLAELERWFDARRSAEGSKAVGSQRLEQCYAKAGLRFADCVTFIPMLDRPRHFGLMQRADLMLDTLGVSGFDAVIQAIECGLPVVSREGEFMRGRLGSGILRRMGMDALVATTDTGYVELAATLAQDGARRMKLRDEILVRRGVLFGDVEPVRALERYLESAAGPRAV